MLFLISLALACTAVLAFYLLYRRNFRYWSQFQGFPSVPGRIFGGNFLQLITLKTHFGVHLKNIYDDAKFADEPVVGIYGLYRPCLLIRDPNLVKSMFIKDFDCFTHRYMQPDAKNDKLSHLMIFYARNPIWKEMRNKFTPFFSSAKLKQTYPLIQAIGSNLDAHLKRSGSQFVADVKDISCLFTIDVISTTIFGLHVNSLENPQEPINVETRRLLDFSPKRAVHHLFIHFVPEVCGLLRVKHFAKRTRHFVRSTISQAIAERERSGLVRNDLIDIFIKLKNDAQHKSRQDMSTYMEALYAQAAEFWIAGFETSASVISHSLMELAKQPDLLDKLRAEILDSFVAGDGDIKYDNINQLQYLHMVVQETMRLYPALAFIDREYAKPEHRKEPYSLKPHHDYTLPQGMPVYVSVYGLHYDEKYWLDPNKFDPERFSPSNCDKIQPMTYLPFGEGPRNCIGSRLGLIDAKVGLINFLKDHYVRVCAKTPMRREFDPKAIVLQVKGGIYLEVQRDDVCDKTFIKNSIN